MEDLSLDDVIAIFIRRRKLFLTTFTVVFALAFLFALHWSRYRATATIEIEQPMISANVTSVAPNDAGATDPGLADRRIAQIEQKVTSIESLSGIIRTLNLYPGINKTMPAAKLSNIMRNKIKLDFVSSTISNPAAAQKESIEQLSAIAFTLSFDYNDPTLAKQALDTIVQRFIEEESAQRRAQGEQTSAFLDSELKTLEASIKEQEAKVAQFRAQYGESGPSAMMFNQQASLSNAMNLQNVESQISASESTISGLRTQLAGTSPYTTVSEDGKQVLTAGSQLHSLQSQYAALTTRYGPEHPDVKKVKAQMDALQANHPISTNMSHTQDADNPIYLQLTSQLSAAQAQLRALTGQRAALAAQQAKFEAALAKNPLIEQQMSQLTLDLDNAKARYRTLKDKKIAAEMSTKLESGSNGERLKVINPSSLPESTNPKRLYLIVGGLFMALMSGIGMVVMVEALSQTVRGVHHLTALVGVAPLVTIPHIPLHPAGPNHG